MFGVSLFYVVTTVVAAERLENTNRLYQRISSLNANVLADNLDRELQSMETVKVGSAVVPKPQSQWSPLWASMKPGGSIWEDCEWKVIRLLFLKEFRVGTEFDYGDYVKRKLSSKLGHSLHVHPTTWSLVMVFSAVFYFIHRAVLASQCDCEGDDHRRLMGVEMGVEMGVARRQLGGSGGGCDCGGAHRRQLGGGAVPPPPACTYTSEGALFEKEWYCSPSEPPFNMTIGNGTETVCILDHYASPNATVEGAYVNKDALVTLLTPGVFSFTLFFSQFYVLFAIKRAVHKVLETKGCADFRQLPSFLRELDSWVTLKSKLPAMAMFEGCGEDFVNAVMDQLKLQFFKRDDFVVREGEMGASMHFICTGSVDVSSKTGGVLGTLVAGDYVGEVALLLDQPRSASIVARNPCACFELYRTSLDTLRADFPYAVEQMEEFARAQHAAALQGKWDATQMSQKAMARHQQHEQVIAEHSARLKAEQETAKQQEEIESKTLKLPKLNLSVSGGVNALGGLAKGATSVPKVVAKKVVTVASDPAKLAIGLAKMAGLPGTALIAGAIPGGDHGHTAGGAHGHGHAHLDRMQGADEIMSQEKKHFLEEVTEITMLFNCFTLGYYCLHAGPVIIPINFHNSFSQALAAHSVILFPACFLMVFLQPLTTKYSSMLDNVLFKDQEAIAEVYHR